MVFHFSFQRLGYDRRFVLDDVPKQTRSRSLRQRTRADLQERNRKGPQVHDSGQAVLQRRRVPDGHCVPR